MSKSIHVKPFYLFIDVVQNAIDFNSFIDYLKNTYKKEVCVLNGQDFAERESGRSSKNDQKAPGKSGHDSATSIVRGLKGRIEGEVSKLTDMIKKQQQAESKSKDQKVSKSRSRPKSALSDHGKETGVFQGEIDLLFIITNFPYQISQIKAMLKVHLSLVAFIAILPDDAPPAPTVYSAKPVEKPAKAPAAKKPQIPGNEYDFTVCPMCYPPARWVILRPKAPAAVPFIEMKGLPMDHETTFKRMEEIIVKVTRAKKEYSSLFGKAKFIDLPEAKQNCDTSEFTKYLFDHNGDFKNALYYQLQVNNFKTVIPPAPPTESALYNEVFAKIKKDITRAVTFESQNEPVDPMFEHISPILYCHLYEIMKWKKAPEDVFSTTAIINFIGSPQHFYAYAGTKFDMLFSQINKQNSLGLPSAYFDWQQWNLCSEYPQVNEILEEALSSATIIEKMVDKSIGVMWIMTMEPIPRTMGQERTHAFCPPAMNGFTEYYEKLFQKEIPVEKKARIPPSSASIIRQKGSLMSLLPPVIERLQKGSLYRLPLETTNCFESVSPYAFDSGLRVRVHRDFINEKPTLSIQAFFKDQFQLVTSDYSTIFTPLEDLRFIKYLNGSLDLLFYEQSLYYNGHDIYAKITEEETVMLSEKGSLVTSLKGQKIICLADGTIATYQKDHWLYVDASGKAYQRKDGVNVPLNLPYAQSTDVGKGLTKMIRPDNIEYYANTDGTRKILLTPEMTIEHMGNEITFEIPNMPVIHYNSSVGFTTIIDKFEIHFSSNQSSIVSNEYQFISSDKSCDVVFDNGEMAFTEGRYQFKTGNQVLCVGTDGEQRVCDISLEIPQKKSKIDIVETKWGKGLPIKDTILEPQHIALHKLYRPHFFAVKNDLSMTEFFRKDAIDFEPPVYVNNESIPHPTGAQVHIISTHEENGIPQIFIENEGLNKNDRALVLKNLHIIKKPKPKGKEGKEEVDNSIYEIEAEGAIHEMSFNTKIFCDALQNCLDRAHQRYLYSLQPEEEEAPEKPLIPMHTPDPNLLIMMQNLHQPRVCDSELNYWQLHESDFAYPLDIPHQPARPLSARCQLNDPPRFFERDNGEPFQITQIDFPRPLHSREVPTSCDSCPDKLTASSKVIDFKNVKAGESAKASVVFTNISKTPMHFSIGQVTCPYIKVQTIPGVLFSGLKRELIIELLPSPPQNISTTIQFKTQSGVFPILVTAQIQE